MIFLRLAILFSAVALMASCSSDGEERPEYMDSYSVKKLEIPPELTRPSSNEELQIPEPSAKALAILKGRDGVEGSVAPKFKGIELQSDGGMYWLLLDKDADDVWPILREFLANEGIKIYRDEPLLGFIETEWLKEYEANRDAGYLKKILNALATDRMDKFRLRLERVGNKQQTRFYVSNRSLEVVVVNEGSSWQQAVPNQMLEKELLNRFVLFAGLGQEAADDVFASYKPYQVRIRRIGDEGSATYEITGNKDIVWKRVIQAMDRLGVDVKTEDKSEGTLEVLVGELAEELMKELVVEKDELAESSWMMNMFSGDKEISKDEEGRISIFLTLKESNSSTHMQLLLENNQPIISGQANKFKAGLISLLK